MGRALPGDAHSPMHLHDCLSQGPAGSAGVGLGGLRGHQRFVEVQLVGRPRRIFDKGASPLERDQLVGRQVLQRLERTDRHAELPPVAGVRDSGVERRGHQPEKIGCHQHQRPSLEALQFVWVERAAQVADVHLIGGIGACDQAQQNVLLCQGGKFTTSLHCLGDLHCELPGNYSVRCDKSKVPVGEACTEDGAASCSTDGVQVKCTQGAWAIDKKWKPKKGETCANRYRVSFDTEKFDAR